MVTIIYLGLFLSFAQLLDSPQMSKPGRECWPCIGGNQYNVRVRGTRAGGVTTDWVGVGPYTCSTTVQTIDAASITGTLDATVLPVATPSVAGAVVPDGTTLTVSGGVLFERDATDQRDPDQHRHLGAMAFDPATNTLYLYGGSGWAAV